MNTFPLYDKLQNIAQYMTIDIEYDKRIAPTINNLSKNNLKIIQGLIIHYSNMHGDLNQNHVSYGGKENKKSKGILYTFSDFPDELRKIILLYITFLREK